MAKGDSLWTEVAGHADRLLQLVWDSSPKGQLQIPTAHVHILGMFWRALRLYDGVLILLKAELPEEAAFLARSLFEECLRLQQLAAEPNRRDALILRWANRSINEKCGLMQVAKQVGLDTDIDAVLARLEEERSHLQEYARRHSITSFPSFLSVRAAAFRFNRKDDYWTYQWAHQSVHGTDAAWLFARRKAAENTACLYGKTNDPVLRASFAHFAAKSIADAAEATFAIFGWPMPPELQETVGEIESVLD